MRAGEHFTFQFRRDHKETDRQPLEGREDLTLGKEVDHVTDAIVLRTGQLVLLERHKVFKLLGVLRRVEHPNHVAGFGVPDVTTGGIDIGMIGTREEIVLFAVHDRGASKVLIWPMEVGKDLFVFLDGQLLELFVGGWQLLAIGRFKGGLLFGIFEHIQAHEDALGIWHLRETPAFTGAIGVDLVGFAHQ